MCGCGCGCTLCSRRATASFPRSVATSLAVGETVILLTLSLQPYRNTCFNGEGGVAECQSRRRLAEPVAAVDDVLHPLQRRLQLADPFVHACGRHGPGGTEEMAQPPV